MAFQTEARIEVPGTEGTGAGAVALLVNPPLVVPQHVPAAELLAADVTGRHIFPGQLVARLQVAAQRIHIAQLIAADVADVPHAPVHLFVVDQNEGCQNLFLQQIHMTGIKDE